MKLLNRFMFSLTFTSLLLSSGLLLAPTAAWSTDADIEALKKNLAMHIPSAKVSHVKKTPIDGLYEVVVDSGIYYMNVSARYVINGDLTDLATRRNITEDTRKLSRKTRIEELGEDKMVVYTPKEVEHTITVVTDIDCPYCRRLHSEMDEYLKNNVKVRYIFMPLKGQSDMETTVSMWCAEDRNLALDLAKSGSDIEKATCDNPILEHLALARGLSVRGTPAIIMENGEMVPGYVPAKKLIPELARLQSAETSN